MSVPVRIKLGFPNDYQPIHVVVALTAWKPVYVKCTPKTDGKEIL